MNSVSSSSPFPVSLELDVHRGRDYLGSSDLPEVLFEASRCSIAAQHPLFTTCILLLHRRRRAAGRRVSLCRLWLSTLDFTLCCYVCIVSCNDGYECDKGGSNGGIKKVVSMTEIMSNMFSEVRFMSYQEFKT